MIDWYPTEGEEPEPEMRAPRRILLFHLAAILDVNKCELDFLQCSSQQRLDYIENIYSAVARETDKLGDYGGFAFKDLTKIFPCFTITCGQS